jgi:hypothetical protein
MAQVVFLRGVNVGGAKRFQPCLLAKELSHLDVTNLTILRLRDLLAQDGRSREG